MRMADRILADGAKEPPGSITVDDDGWLQTQVVECLRAGAPVLLADNVADYCRRHTFTIGELPCEAPPWPEFWIEWRSDDSLRAKQRIGTLVQDFGSTFRDSTGKWRFDGNVGRMLVEHVRSEGEDPENIKFVVCHQTFVEQQKVVYGPMCFVMLALDERGRQLGNCWKSCVSEEAFANINANVGEYVIAMTSVAMQTVAFLHCKNVSTEQHHEPNQKLRKAHKRRHGSEMVRWQTVKLEVPRRQGGGGAGGTADPHALHIVAGHFAHYGNCCPTAHEPRGKLFGRNTGVYWMPAHLRGDPRRGVVLTDRELVTGTSTDEPAEVA